ncbi:isoaspartyl peptidase/L-asparaginase [bacterium]|nr:isoaspartyl peptidase/L-asparaginase [bacterium]
MKGSILVHGGAGRYRSSPEKIQELLNRSVEAGLAAFERGALESAVVAVEVMESSGLLNAGKGGSRQADGTIRMDASAATGQLFGSVIAMPGCWPASRCAARLLATPYPIRAGESVVRWARQEGFTQWEPDADAYAHWEKKSAPSPGTVGAVVVVDGVPAVVTSTGGRERAAEGRVGDTALPGCGSSAGKSGAVSWTGIGEAILRMRMADWTRGQLKDCSPQEAAERAVEKLESDELNEGEGGVIIISSEGEMGWAFNTEAMAVAWGKK